MNVLQPVMCERGSPCRHSADAGRGEGFEAPANAYALCASASIVVLTRNAELYLPLLLARLQTTEPAPKRVLFIDTRSTDRTAMMIL